MPLPCQVPGHSHVERCTTPNGFELPFCEAHQAALPDHAQNALEELSDLSVLDIESHQEARSLVLKAIAWLLGRTAIPGICRACGCTQEFGCEDGCSWANKRRTLCSRCVPARTPKRGRARGAGEKRPARRQ